jgi:hypothetical protein
VQPRDDLVHAPTYLIHFTLHARHISVQTALISTAAVVEDAEAFVPLYLIVSGGMVLNKCPAPSRRPRRAINSLSRAFHRSKA